MHHPASNQQSCGPNIFQVHASVLIFSIAVDCTWQQSVCCSFQVYLWLVPAPPPNISPLKAGAMPPLRLGHQPRADGQSTWLVHSNQLAVQLLFGVMPVCHNAHSSVSAGFLVPEKDKPREERPTSSPGTGHQAERGPPSPGSTGTPGVGGPQAAQGNHTCYHFPGRNSTPRAAPEETDEFL